ncbi:hypothetical protein A3E66_05675 [Candidatus Daviesbacteria bacterium RIFCSPHIGHO2_12_FULL_37_16]|uniref:Phosphoglycerate kinase n=3 Tax=Candidatus Daviesiibacteriota TaxID=1752718 RepID=A0A0G0EWB7_9BACT|nr:MAG: Phosphoglycerate kinase [Candidatus Daviesbacteria bacterium GW2011_GWB1_36_5]KKQ16021.1 MAG: Phosphoglycerate kinase [Candidatus Daviesbacteria bacterium GW2011_GWA1_36_8]OGE31476.1 MAG: hypothetical protein A3C99_02420 [Candidatus Daviesbacteria bacterium RIFCSPHIGHO2_02_FULL_37_9]OGE36356.1 MAG: hypothetical protein A3E66_05675 [Candidatus Daviesbacteria bacterium RIFCSPHIGHO2_12_FULL_37_16]
MKLLDEALISGKKVLLRLDLDVPIENGRVVDDFRLLAGMETLGFCLDHAQSVILMGHIGRPQGEDPDLTVRPIVKWLEEGFGHIRLPEGKLHILENLRFEAGEDDCDQKFASELASFGDVFINEAFASHHPSASTTLLPKLLPHGAGFTFAEEVNTLEEIRERPQKPFVAIIGGVKIEDKLPAVLALAKIADAVLVGGKIADEIKLENTQVPPNVMVGKLTEDKEDIADETVDSWQPLIERARLIIWNGPLGRVEDEKYQNSRKIAQIITTSNAKTILGGGDTITYVDELGLLNKFSFVSTGGGAMLEFLIKGTLPSIEALE